MKAARIFVRLIGLVVLGLTMNAIGEAIPWSHRETEMTHDGKLTFLNKPWWNRAKALNEGQSFTLDLNGDGRPDTIVMRKDGNIVEAIDDTGDAKEIWNKVSTTFVVSYHASGIVDRMVSYIDNDSNGKADEVELRYFRDGYLRYAWFGKSFGGDAAQIFAIKNWQYAGNDLGSKFRGNTQIYLNKYDPASRTWVPLSECPFSFWDIDQDGRTDVTLRVSAAPLKTLHGPDTDYANNYDYMWASEATPLKDVGALNIRLSFNIDARPRTDPEGRPHSNFGFTSVGAQPYDYLQMRDMNPRRRAPQTTIHMNWKKRWDAAILYPASETGFTWDEARSAWRWEGQFWIYERVYLSNTGSPTQRWNMRREYSSKASSERNIYFSEADKRYHLMGAEEGWLEAGHIVGDKKDLEFRWFDSDGDGYLDTVEVYRPGLQSPVRTAHFDPRPLPAKLDVSELSRQYNEKVLPEAIAEDTRFIAALKKVASDPVGLQYENAAAKSKMAERRRYCLDIARELHFLKVRDAILAYEATLPYPDGQVDTAKFRDPKAGDSKTGYTLGDTLRFWSVQRQLRKFIKQYGDGQLDAAATTLAHIKIVEETAK